jgi:mitogen-activated protein kinase kinase kinase 13
MALRRSQDRGSSSPTSSTTTRRKYALRHSSNSRRRAFALVRRTPSSIPSSHDSGASPSIETCRPVLVALHPNLRRLPSRSNSTQKEAMRDASQNIYIGIGTKRKRVTSTNENAHSGGRPLRGHGKPKRMRSASCQYRTSDDGESSSMDVDVPCSWLISDGSDPEEDDADSCLSQFLLTLLNNILFYYFSFSC